MANTKRFTTENTSHGSYNGRFLYLDISEAIDAPNNKSVLTWTLNVVGGSAAMYGTGPTTVTINGTQVYYKARTTSSEFPAIKGSTSGTLNIAHNADGTHAAITVVFSTAVYYGEWAVADYGGTMQLTPIDRTAPVMTFSTSAVTVNGATISAVSTSVCDVWYYSTNGGSSWTQFSTTEGTSASVTLSNLSPATSYNVMVRGRKKSNQVLGVSAAKTVKTLGGAQITSVIGLTADLPSPSFDVTLTVYQAYPVDITVSYNGTTLITRTGVSVSVGTGQVITVTPTSTEIDAIYAAMPNDAVITATCSVTSKDGNTVIQTSTLNMSIRVTSASAPSFSGWTYQEVNSEIVNLLGTNQVAIQYYNSLQASITSCSGNHGASIAGRTLQIGGAVSKFGASSPASIGLLNVSGDVAAIATVTDSRGLKTSITKTITFLPYESPKVSVTTLRRANDVDAEVQLVFEGTISPLTVSGVQKNALTLARYRVRETKDGATWSSWTSILSSVTQNGANFSFSEMELTTLDPKKSYEFNLQIEDSLLLADQYDEVFVIPQGTPLVVAQKGRLVINGDLVVNGNVNVSGDLNVTGSITHHTIYYGTLRGTGDVDKCYIYLASDTATKYYGAGVISVVNGDQVVCCVDATRYYRVILDGVVQTLTTKKFTFTPAGDFRMEFSVDANDSTITITTS